MVGPSDCMIQSSKIILLKVFLGTACSTVCLINVFSGKVRQCIELQTRRFDILTYHMENEKAHNINQSVNSLKT